MSDPQPQFIEVGEGEVRRRIAYLAQAGDRANGPGVVWFGGLKSDMFATKASALSRWAEERRRPYLRFDYSGHGASDRAFEDCTVGEWLEDSLAVLAHTCRGEQILVGSSMGGWLTLLAMRQLARTSSDLPYAIAGAVLIAPAWDMTESLMWERFKPEARRAIETEGAYHRPSAYGDDPYIISARLIEEGRNHLFKGQPFDPGAPVHIIQGMRDPDVPYEHVMGLIELVERDDVTLTLVKDGEHRMSRPQDLALLLREIELVSQSKGVSDPHLP